MKSKCGNDDHSAVGSAETIGGWDSSANDQEEVCGGKHRDGNGKDFQMMGVTVRAGLGFHKP